MSAPVPSALAGSAPAPPSRPVFVPLERQADLAAEAAARVARAEAQGHATGYTRGLRRAERELEVRRAELEARHVERLTRLDEQVAARVAALDAARRALDARVAPVVDEAEQALVALALDLAEAVLGRVVRDDPRAAALAAVDRATGGVDPALVVALRLHPDDADLVRDALGGDAGAPSPVAAGGATPVDPAGAGGGAGAPDASGTVVLGDPTLARGDAEADLPVGHVDARLATAVARVRAALLDEGSTS